ncbi:NUDIX domain-containing protein [Kutzneria sp. CA-103260]|uniref:NUDIX domain-containing protein n=1 Tax=Kutzneria sp. CA-103260 TaxID=2802641 RepID=UPI001BAD9AB4|nr:NUDIX hydrolase [Kutzneria sp. CA-103260]QUQ64889.1 NUDIX hydrolase [Kutzneria sp. CA-103260]
MDLLPFDEYAAQLNRKRTAAGVLFRDPNSRVLLVETSYKPNWEIPGGSVEAHEAPWTTAVREVREELGIDVVLGRLLVIDHIPEAAPMPEGLAFIFDGGIITDTAVSALRFHDPEIVSASLFTLDEAMSLVNPGLASRISVALEARATGVLALCAAGKPVTAF